MEETEVIEAKEIELATPVAPSTLFGTRDPAVIIADASVKATALADVIRKQHLTTRINNKEHVQIEGWTLLGTMLGVFASEVWSKPSPQDWEEQGLPHPKWWEAKVNAVTMTGSVVGSATGMCSRTEKTWASRDDYAIRSMAITRAASKALRMPLGFVMILAGFEATPEEEMPVESTTVEPQPGSGERKATQPQIKKLAMLASNQGWDDDERRKRAGVESFTDLTMRQASGLIEEWSKLPVSEGEIVEGEVVDETQTIEGVSVSGDEAVDLWQRIVKWTDGDSEKAAQLVKDRIGTPSPSTAQLREFVGVLLREGK